MDVKKDTTIATRGGIHGATSIPAVSKYMARLLYICSVKTNTNNIKHVLLNYHTGTSMSRDERNRI
jgi:hypothetical protein